MAPTPLITPALTAAAARSCVWSLRWACRWEQKQAQGVRARRGSCRTDPLGTPVQAARAAALAAVPGGCAHSAPTTSGLFRAIKAAGAVCQAAEAPGARRRSPPARWSLCFRACPGRSAGHGTSRHCSCDHRGPKCEMPKPMGAPGAHGQAGANHGSADACERGNGDKDVSVRMHMPPMWGAEGSIRCRQAGSPRPVPHSWGGPRPRPWSACGEPLY